MFYFIRYQDRTRGGYYFIIYHTATDAAVFESATYETIDQADEIANDVIKEFTRQGA